MEETQKQMDEAQKKGEEQYEAMKLRIKYMYEAGEPHSLSSYAQRKTWRIS